MYDYDWSELIYELFYQDHILACREMNRLYAINIEAVVKAIQANSKRWRGYKSLVIHAEENIKMYWKHYHGHGGVRGKYSTFDEYLRKQFTRRLFPAPLDLVDTENQTEHIDLAP